jgi:hypothetical protein
MAKLKNTKLILFVIVFAQFASTSLWFAGNAVLTDLVQLYNLRVNALSYTTSGVKFGFITGTLMFAIYTIADRYSPSKVFLVCSLAGAAFNLPVLQPQHCRQLWQRDLRRDFALPVFTR